MLGRFALVFAIPFVFSFGCSDGDSAGSEAYAANTCVSAKQVGAGAYCKRVLEAWATWEASQDDAARDAEIQSALGELQAAWSAAEAGASDAGSDCADQALTSAEAGSLIDVAVEGLVESINSGLDLGSDAQCGADLLTATANACNDVLTAESEHISNLETDSDGSALANDKTTAFEAFSNAWAEATSGSCPTDATQEGTSTSIGELTDGVVLNTIVAVNLDESQFTTISPTGTTEYLGKELTPVCMEGSPYHFFVKRGTVNKLVMYYQGGGACWDGLTCSVPTCDDNVDPEGGDNPNNRSTGFADRENPDNPFRDWHQVFVSYCGCDVHYGDAAQDYSGGVHVEHRGFHNAQYVEKWAREHFLNPETVFVTGSSAGAYGAWFHAPLLHDVWPASQFHVLADAGNGVITAEFLQNEFSNWDFVENLPDDIPGVLEAITGGEGMVAYTEAVANEFPDTNWAHYSTAFDGGEGGQTGFYNIMLNENDPFAALTWWEASCAFGQQMRLQSLEISDAVPTNYRYYIGTGSRHTMWGNNKVYDDTTGGVQTIVDWIDAMLLSGPAERDPDWSNEECTDCGLLLVDDPAPDPLEAPFEQQVDEVRIVCP